jgi:hypothetical protein
MDVKITIPENLSIGLSVAANEEISNELNKYTDEILLEAQRIESGQNTSKMAPDINRLMIQQAILYLRRMPRKTGNNIFKIISSILSPISGVAVGILYRPQDFTDTIKLWLFIVICILLTVSTIFSVIDPINGGKK